MIRVQKVRLYPNQTMKKVLDDLCNYRRYCWNQGLALWNDMYDSSLILGDKTLRPSERKVRNELVANKDDWQYQLSARCLQLAISDLGKAWNNFFNNTPVFEILGTCILFFVVVINIYILGFDDTERNKLKTWILEKLKK